MSRNEEAVGEIAPEMAAQRMIGYKRTRTVNRLFNVLGRGLAVLRNVGPDVKNICFGERRKSIGAHVLEERQLSFIA